MRSTALTNRRAERLWALLDQFDALGHRGVRGNAVEIAQLKDAHAERDADFFVELLFAAGNVLDQKSSCA